MSTLAEEKIDVSAAASAEDHSGRPSYDDVNVPFVVVLGIISAIVTYVSIVGVQGLYYHFEDAQIREKEYGATIAAAKTIEEQKESLYGFNEAKIRVDGGQSVRSIPIDLAMNLTLAEFANDSHAQDGHDSGNQKAGGHDADHDKAADEDEKKTDTESNDNPKANDETNDKNAEKSKVDQSDADTKSDAQGSAKADDGDKESKSVDNKKEDDSEKADKE